MAKIRVVLADQHQALIAKVRQTLDERFEVINVVEDGQQSVDTVRLLKPDVLVIEISLPVLNGFQVARTLQGFNCSTKVVFLTIEKERDFVATAFSAGASGYVIKAQLSTDLVPAIGAALQGHTFVSRISEYVRTSC